MDLFDFDETEAFLLRALDDLALLHGKGAA